MRRNLNYAKNLTRQSRNQWRNAGFTAEAQVVRKNRNLRFHIVFVDRCFFIHKKTTVFSRCVDSNWLSSAETAQTHRSSLLHDLLPLFSTRAPSPPLQLVSSADESRYGGCR